MTDVPTCRVCGDYHSDSRIDVLEHLSEEHTLSDRLEALIVMEAEPEDTNP
jgi:hypothetical protein